ncbi:MAG: carbohydrate ABC transporter permease [Victivallales bacterium]|nr:carbohydrate ABC transporter permease [Victivallales bacterium]
MTTNWRAIKTFLKFFFITLFASAIFVPFIWMICTAFKPANEVEMLNFIPHVASSDNFKLVLKIIPNALSGKYLNIDLLKWIFNSIFVASWVTVLQVTTSSLAAFAFSRIRWKFRDQVFVMYLATMMIPGLVLTIPQFQIMVSIGFVNTYAGLIIPMAFSAFGTFMLRQFMLGIPLSYDEAAEIDGASWMQIYLDIILPLTKPGLITLAIFTFLGNYRNLMWPLVMIKDEAIKTVPIGLLSFQGSYHSQTELLMAATMICIIPLIVMFIIMQKKLVRGINLGGGVKE